MAMKEISRSELEMFNAKMIEAEQDIDTREEMYERIFDELESDLVLLGATSVEDRL